MIHIQKLTLSDIPDCINLLNATLAYPWKELETIFHKESCFKIGAFIKNQLVGLMIVSCIPDEGEILMCVVHPGYWRKNIASMLLTYTFENLQGITSVFLEVDITNLAAQQLYKKFGFKPAGLRKDYYLHPDQSYHDAIVMKLTLNNSKSH